MVEKIKLFFALVVAKIIVFLLRFFKSLGGTAAPGLIALKIDPLLVKKLARQFPTNIVITGTNGKTTTARLIASILESEKIKIIHNRAGSNLLRGIASEIVKKVNLKGKLLNIEVAIWESDEAILPQVLEQINAQYVIITNLFRDQLDRYGEIDTLAKNWEKALKNLSSKTKVILNADDPTIAYLGKDLKAKVIYFGISDQNVGQKRPPSYSDALLCPFCLSKLSYSRCFVSHLGVYQCPKCGRVQPKKQAFCVRVIKKDINSTQVDLNYQNKIYTLKIPLPGIYNVYNSLAAFTISHLLKIRLEKIITCLENFTPAFGRVEKIKVGQKLLRIFLVKNPTGFNETLQTLSSLKNITSLIILNDKIADGRDISWIWDVDFGKTKGLFKKIIISGTRTEDMILRLKYALKNEKLIIQRNLKKAIDTLLNQPDKNLYILPTYTAMLEVREILAQRGLVRWSWED